MLITSPYQILLPATWLLVCAVLCGVFSHGQDIESASGLIRKLELHNNSLQLALIESNKAEEISRTQLDQVRDRLEALGKNILDGSDDRLIDAASDLQIANEKIQNLVSASSKLRSSIESLLLNTVVYDSDKRSLVESAIRELDAITDSRQERRSDVRNGDLQTAVVISIDQESGLLVLNLGENQGAKIGMTFKLNRGQQTYGEAILADVRKGIAGAFLDKSKLSHFTPKLGDNAKLLTQN